MWSTPAGTSTKRPMYEYRPLLEDDAIRVLLLYPAADVSAELKCAIEHITLSQYKKDLINHYTALSYVWGLLTEQRHIVVNGCSFYVTPNLDSALRHIRDDKGIIRVWADAICINQQDIQERSKQVQLMGSVYTIARHTIIYLGDSSQESNSLFNTLHHLCDQNRAPFSAERTFSKYSDTEVQELRKTIQTHIVDNTWFTRIWIFQELLLSSDPWIQCGKQRLRWGDVCQLSLLTRYRISRISSQKKKFGDLGELSKSSDKSVSDSTISNLPRRVDTLSHLEDMHKARQNFQDHIAGRGAGNSMLTYLEARRGLGVTDPGDMIYGHLGIASDALSGQLGLQVDYGKSCSDLYADIAQYFIKRDGNYRILGYVEDVLLEERRVDLPSWAPDWTSNTLRFNLSIPPFKDNIINDIRLVKFSFPLSKNGKRCLSSLGTILGRVQYLGLPLYFAHCTPSEIREAWSSCVTNSLVFEKGRSNKALQLREEQFKEQFSDMIRQFARNVGFEDTDTFLTAMPDYTVSRWRMMFAELVNNKANGGPGLSLDHWTSRRGDKYPGLEDKTINTRLQIPIHPFALLSALSFEFSLMQDAAGDLGRLREKLRVVEGRRLCLYTYYNPECRRDTYHIALVPQFTQRSDLICALNGDSRYFAFREVVADEGKGGDDASTLCNLVGMSYIERMSHDSMAFRTRLVLQ